MSSAEIEVTSANDGSDTSGQTSSAGAGPEAGDGASTLVQFVVVRRDLLKTLNWPVGSVIAQACHSCLAVVWEHREDPDVAAYLGANSIDSMHKVVKECKGEAQLMTLAEKLTSEGMVFKLWMEQPENIPTALALKPYPRGLVAPLLKKYSLFK